MPETENNEDVVDDGLGTIDALQPTTEAALADHLDEIGHDVPLVAIEAVAQKSETPDYPRMISRYRAGFEALMDKDPTLVKDHEQLNIFLDAVDTEGEANLTHFEPSMYKGVRIPMTAVAVDNVARKIDVDSVPDDPNRDHAYTVIYPGWSAPPSGHPYEYWGDVYNRVSRDLVAIGKRQSTVLTMGSPHSLTGSVTAEWVDALKQEGFVPYGKVYAEYLAQQLPPVTDSNRNKLKVKLVGYSTGSKYIMETIEELVRQRPDLAPLIDSGAISCMLNIPADSEKKGKRSVFQKLRYPVGFAGQVAGLFAVSKQQRIEAFGVEDTFREEMSKLSEEAGATIDTDESQSKLKKAAAWATGGNLVKDDERERPSFDRTKKKIIEGVFDPIAPRPFEAAKLLAKKLRTLGLPPNSTPINTGLNINTSAENRTQAFEIKTSHYLNYREHLLPRLVKRLGQFENLLS